MPVSEFDELGGLYEATFGLPWRRHLEVPTVLNLLGDLTGRDVLDIGSGSGWYCRRLAQLGARRVVGLEVSSGMVDFARRHTTQPEVQYVLGELPAEMHGSFDVTISVYVFGYATSREQLDNLCRMAAAALRSDGRFLVLTLNPDYEDDPEYYASYGFRVHSAHPRSDGTPIPLEVRFAEHNATLTITYWSRHTLAESLRSAGFSSVTWPGYHVTEQGIEEEGALFWKNYLTQPHTTILDCRLQ